MNENFDEAIEQLTVDLQSEYLDQEIMQLAVRIRHLTDEGNDGIAFAKLQKSRDLAEALIPRLEERSHKSA